MMGCEDWAGEHLHEQQATTAQRATLCEELHRRNGGDHGFMMIYGNNVECQPVRYFYMLHALETLVIARHAPHILDADNVRTLRRVATPYNWDFEEWHDRMNEVHAHPEMDPEPAVTHAIHEFTARKPIQPPFRDKKTRETVLFFTMLTYIGDLFAHWVSGAPNGPRVLDPPTFEMFMLYDQPHCHSVKSMIALMLYGRTRRQYTNDALGTMRAGVLRAARSEPFGIPHTPVARPDASVSVVDPMDEEDCHARYDDILSREADVYSTDKQSRHAVHEEPEQAFEALFGAENPHSHMERLLDTQTVDLEHVMYHISSNYVQEVCCLESTARVAQQKRAAEKRKREMERERLVHRKCHALQ